MKNITTLVTIIILFYSITISAQNQYGRQNERNSNSTNSERSKEDLEKLKVKNIENSISKLKIDLELNELQAIAIKQIINESIINENIIMKKEYNEEDKMKSIQVLTENTDTKITKFFTIIPKKK